MAAVHDARRRRLRLATCLLALLAPWAVPSARANLPPAELAALISEAELRIVDFVPVIELCVRRRDTTHAVFHGCIDWHSSVHGHWALAAAARMTRDARLRQLLEQRLTQAGVAEERALLRAQPRFEMPYVRAWILRLATEYRALTRDDRLDRMAQEVADSLLRHLDRAGPDLRRGSYESHSWALINLVEHLRARGDRPRLARAETLARAAIGREGAAVTAACARDIEGTNFMAVCANALWLASLVMTPDQFRALAMDILPRLGWMQPVGATRIAHQNGLNFSRAWGLWRAWEATRAPGYATLYAAHVRATIARPESWAGDYATVAHWVAQFGVLAMAPLVERR